MEEIRINKYLALCGVASRRGADSLVADGKVYINNVQASSGSKVLPGDIVTVDGRRVYPENEKIVIAFNKPRGVTVTEKDEHAERTVFDYIKCDKRLTYAGRLDKDSEGLLLLTNDGDLINAIMKGINGHEKEYLVKLSRIPSDKILSELRNGVYIDELKATTRPCKISEYKDDYYDIVLTQGMNRQIRRMFGLYGIEVKELKRIRVMNVRLDKLKPGEYRELSSQEKEILYRLAGMGKFVDRY